MGRSHGFPLGHAPAGRLSSTSSVSTQRCDFAISQTLILGVGSLTDYHIDRRLPAELRKAICQVFAKGREKSAGGWTMIGSEAKCGNLKHVPV